MLRIVKVSFLISVLSLVLVLFFPIGVTVQSGATNLSPYYLDIIKLQEKTALGLHSDAPEWNQLQILKHKNRMWIESKINRKSPMGHFFDYIKVKSANLSLMLFFVWLASFYYFFRKKSSIKNLLVLTFPVVFLGLGMIMLIPFVFISSAVIGGYVLIKLKNR